MAAAAVEMKVGRAAKVGVEVGWVNSEATTARVSAAGRMGEPTVMVPTGVATVEKPVAVTPQICEFKLDQTGGGQFMTGGGATVSEGQFLGQQCRIHIMDRKRVEP